VDRLAPDGYLHCLADEVSTKDKVFNVVAKNATVKNVVDAIRDSLPTVKVRYSDQDVLTELSFEVDGQNFMDVGFSPKYDLEQGVDEVIRRLSALKLD